MSLSNLDFLSALFRDIARDTCATLHSFGGDPAKNGRWNAMPWHPSKSLPTLNPFANNYVCVSSFHPTPENKYYRRKILFAGLHCVMIDDLGTKLPMSDLKMKPTALIETSPDNFQAWLFLEKPILTIGAAETLIDQMIAAGISTQMDPGMKGVTRVARVPVGSNGKPKYHGPAGEVWRQRVREAALERRYTPEDIAQAYGLDLTLRREAPPPLPPRSGINDERAFLIDWLKTLGYHKEEVRSGYHEITCPWSEDHTDKAQTGTYFMEPEALNSWHGGFVCHHGHCGERDISDVVGWVRSQKEEATSTVPEHIKSYTQEK